MTARSSAAVPIPAAVLPAAGGPSSRRILLASLVGTSVEFYDFYIYATAAALVFPTLFFPAESESARLMLSYASLGLAFLARPLGAALFGHFGDRMGRKSTLVASLMLMGGSTLAIAFLPTYGQVGLLAPFLLCVLRFAQGLGLGGEWGGAALLAVENAPKGWAGRFGSVPQLGAPVGFLAANGLFLLLGLGLDEAAFRSWGWRLPFLASALLVGLGLWVRLKLTETAEFRAALEHEAPASVPIAELFRSHLRGTLAGTFGAVACFALYYIATAFALGHGTTRLGFPRETFLSMQLFAILFMAAGIALAGWWADRSSTGRVLAFGCGGVVIAGLLMQPLMGGGTIAAVTAWLAIALFAMGFVYGPLGAWLPGLFPPRVRYTGASMAFNVGGVIGGAVTPMAAEAFAQAGGLTPVGLYLAMAGLFSLGGLWLVPRGAAK
ncbi:MFS transporter [Sphingomonas desiccabilis]|uniref:MFS transporter n=1 Tax=Sphingomonas desiccabilis TaxID=429134 RepID=A0A4Q2J043_9SPHN|nr:MFS transporter [Sphingomonas desiccabilis]MBB3910352.1 MFS family permease [Sphingomonas desiccabilis]RXZ35010.1 MFS transporter [Sphingomonas desiccabilis]